MAEGYGIYVVIDKNPENLSPGNLNLIVANMIEGEVEPAVGMILEINFAIDGKPAETVHYRIIQVEKSMPKKMIICELARESC